MLRLCYAVLSSDLLIDRESNSTSLIRTVENVFAQQFPVQLPNVFLATMWELDPEKVERFSVALQLAPPTGKQVAIGRQEVTNTATPLHKLNFFLPGLKVEQPGRHVIHVAYKLDKSWVAAAKLPVFVHQRKEETVPAS